jgi:amidophosphoribosyltransferase
MEDAVRHNCGFCVAHTLHDAYSFIRSLQHRGREAAGIAAVGEGRIDVIKWAGGVDRFDITDLHKIFPSPHYHTYMAHVRYATRGSKDEILDDAHPHVLGGQVEERGSHILIRDCEMAAVHNGQVDLSHFTDLDLSRTKSSCDTEALLYLYRRDGEHEFLRKVPGAYSMAIADWRKRDVIVMRDRTGIKPGVLGWKDGKYGVASEDIAFRKNGGDFIEDLDPGAIYYLSPEGDFSKESIVEPQRSHCFFEWNYIADVDSNLNHLSARRVREVLGEILAEEFSPDDADVVTFLPRCPEVAARSYARSTGLPFLPMFYKMRGERSFQGSNAQDRKHSIDSNLHVLPGLRQQLAGKTVVLIDDSIVRGNNSIRARELLYEQLGVKKAYLVSYTPPIGIVADDGIPRGCMFGVDMPPNPPEGDGFIARGRDTDDISRHMGMPVVYVSVPGMLRAFERLGLGGRDLCTYCIGGSHPFAGCEPIGKEADEAQLDLLSDSSGA